MSISNKSYPSVHRIFKRKVIGKYILLCANWYIFIANWKSGVKWKLCFKTTKYRIYGYRKVASIKCKKTPETSIVRRPRGGALMPCEDSIAQKEEGKTSGKDSANEKPWTCSIKVLSFPCCGEDLHLAHHGWDSKLQLSADSE